MCKCKILFNALTKICYNVATPYTPHFIGSMLDHYQDRLAHTYTDDEAAFVRMHIRMYKRMQKKSNHPIQTTKTYSMQTPLAS